MTESEIYVQMKNIAKDVVIQESKLAVVNFARRLNETNLITDYDKVVEVLKDYLKEIK